MTLVHIGVYAKLLAAIAYSVQCHFCRTVTLEAHFERFTCALCDYCDVQFVEWNARVGLRVEVS
jgi:hypothetical protein